MYENILEVHRLEEKNLLVSLYTHVGNIYICLWYTLRTALRWSMKTWGRSADTDVTFHFRSFCERDGASFVHLINGGIPPK